MDSVITTSIEYTSPLQSRGITYEPLRTVDGDLMTDLNGNVLISLTATYRSILTKESFITAEV